MRSIERSCKIKKIENPSLATYPCLAIAVTGRKYARRNIAKAFEYIMPKDEYEKDEARPY